MSTIEGTSIQAPAEIMSQPEIPLPPLAEGYVRLYRGDIVDDAGKPIINDVTGRSTALDTAGRWFTDNPNDAEGYAGGRQLSHDESHRRHQFVDVPEEVAQRFNARTLPVETMIAANGGHAFSNEWLLPSEIAAEAVEYRVDHDTEGYEPWVNKGLDELFCKPEIRSVIEEIGLDNEDLKELEDDPVRLNELLAQFSMLNGQNSLPLDDRHEFRQWLSQLMIGVESANKRRYLGSQAHIPENPLPYSPVDGSMQSQDDW
ncbi:hypothetical protein KA047_02330 [Candidatus Saccharibacteria bacterium]|nr:hypothetical protein [Candidatus Saccharibacteria bacterium]